MQSKTTLTSHNKTLTSWSFSALQAYERCPHRAKLQYINRLPQKELDPSSPLHRGIRLHKAIEEFLLRITNVLPQDLKTYSGKLNQLRKRNDLHIEEKWNLSNTWKKTSWAKAWLRVIPDVWFLDGGRLQIIDWKSGKLEGNQFKAMQQAALEAVAAKQLFPEIYEIQTCFEYVDHDKQLTTLFGETQIDYFKKDFEKRTSRMLSDTDFKAKPNKSNCRFCPYGTNVGTGACTFATPYEE